MPALREDPLTGLRVIVAPERAGRPFTFRTRPEVTHARDPVCPFCRGNEAMTPPEVARTGTGVADSPGWHTRVVPNLYPIVGNGLRGAHEVVVLSPAHDRSLAHLDLDAAADVFCMLRDRAAHHLADACMHVQAFINHGEAAGASIEHPHAQLVGLGIVPPAVDAALARFDAAGSDLVADAIEQARNSPFTVIDDGPVAAWCPPASASAYEVVCALPYARQRFDRATDDEVTALAHAIQIVLRRLEALLGDFAYNVVLHSGPRDDERPYHWHARISPRLAVVAGFEQGTGILVNAVAPEVAAAALRDASASGAPR